MSLIVTFNGQFKPNSSSKIDTQQLKKIRRIVPVFNDILQAVAEEHEEKQEKRVEKKPKPQLRKYQKNAKAMKRRYYARDIMSTKVKTLNLNDSIEAAVKLLAKNNFHHIPIMKEDKIFGIISDRLLLSIIAKGTSISTSLDEVMVKEVFSAQENTNIADIARAFLDERINCLPIIDQDLHLKGIVTSSDLLNLLIVSSPFISYA
jgi:CBS domain-containing protein